MTNMALSTIPAEMVYSGKVRDTYKLSGDRYLMVASDRISAFDVILPSLVPGKGEVLTQLSSFWFARAAHLIPNHLTGESVADLGWDPAIAAEIESRSMIVDAAVRVPIECVVRGYLAGSGWVEYERSGSVAGHTLPSGLFKCSQLPEPIFTPARKNDTGHDENITREQLKDDIGTELAGKLESISLEIYWMAATHAANQGVIIADTKFEFGFINGELSLIDELLTPDSSRFWDAATWQPGQEADSWDKQFVRNWLLASGWDKEPPGPELPSEIITGTTERYQDAFLRITGLSIDEWLGRASGETES